MPTVVGRPRLSTLQKIYVAGFRKGLREGMADGHEMSREELRSTFAKLAELHVRYAELAERHHRAMRDRAVDEAQHEREQNPFRPLH